MYPSSSPLVFRLFSSCPPRQSAFPVSFTCITSPPNRYHRVVAPSQSPKQTLITASLYSASVHARSSLCCVVPLLNAPSPDHLHKSIGFGWRSVDLLWPWPVYLCQAAPLTTLDGAGKTRELFVDLCSASQKDRSPRFDWKPKNA
ncbi:hypothetical protein L596_011890 [Steinernema carpocapsae]|uniref:Uncharacterized protein n=1 Tax=Steinernema carpocapsae TaxID=34508 RepID=A0A4U5NW84_STECR|nr:hypothetical protein L596_011890 [Steinernema carpocapsae]